MTTRGLKCRRRPRHIIKASIATLCLTIFAKSAYAVNADPFDYMPFAPGTNLFIDYFEYSDVDRLNVKGGGNVSGHLDSEVGLLRYLHYTKLWGMTIATPDIIIPYGSVNNVQVGGERLNSSSGVGDPTVATTFWLLNRPETLTYFAIDPLLTLPLGTYHRTDAINFGSNRFEGDLQVAFQTAFGTDGLANRVVWAVYGDLSVFGDNTSYVGNSTLSQHPSWQVQSWLTYSVNHSLNVSAGYSASMGGRQFVNNTPNGTATEEQQVRLEVQDFLTRQIQLVGEVTHDVRVVGGFKQTIGLNARVMYVF